MVCVHLFTRTSSKLKKNIYKKKMRPGVNNGTFGSFLIVQGQGGNVKFSS